MQENLDQTMATQLYIASIELLNYLKRKNITFFHQSCATCI